MNIGAPPRPKRNNKSDDEADDADSDARRKHTSSRGLGAASGGTSKDSARGGQREGDTSPQARRRAVTERLTTSSKVHSARGDKPSSSSSSNDRRKEASSSSSSRERSDSQRREVTSIRDDSVRRDSAREEAVRQRRREFKDSGRSNSELSIRYRPLKEMREHSGGVSSGPSAAVRDLRGGGDGDRAVSARGTTSSSVATSSGGRDERSRARGLAAAPRDSRDRDRDREREREKEKERERRKEKERRERKEKEEQERKRKAEKEEKSESGEKEDEEEDDEDDDDDDEDYDEEDEEEDEDSYYDSDDLIERDEHGNPIELDYDDDGNLIEPQPVEEEEEEKQQEEEAEEGNHSDSSSDESQMEEDDSDDEENEDEEEDNEEEDDDDDDEDEETDDGNDSDEGVAGGRGKTMDGGNEDTDDEVTDDSDDDDQMSARRNRGKPQRPAVAQPVEVAPPVRIFSFGRNRLKERMALRTSEPPATGSELAKGVQEPEGQQTDPAAEATAETVAAISEGEVVGTTTAEVSPATAAQANSEPSAATTGSNQDQVVEAGEKPSAGGSDEPGNNTAVEEGPEGENYGCVVLSDGITAPRCRLCCMWKAEAPSGKPHTCKPALLGHLFAQCPTKNMRSHIREHSIVIHRGDAAQRGQLIVGDDSNIGRPMQRGERIVLRRRPLSARKESEKGRSNSNPSSPTSTTAPMAGRPSWYTLQKQRRAGPPNPRPSGDATLPPPRRPTGDLEHST